MNDSSNAVASQKDTGRERERTKEAKKEYW